MATARIRRLAIIGGGPRAAYALESLARRFRAGVAVPEHIDVFEPRPRLGEGMAYASDQPEFIRLNLPDHVIDAGAVMPAGEAVAVSESGGRPAPSPLRSHLIDGLANWREGVGDSGAGAPTHLGLPRLGLPEDFYPSRAAAGRYLAHLAATAIDALAATTVTHLRERAIGLARTRNGFSVSTSSARRDYDAVLLVSGHAGVWPGLGGGSTSVDADSGVSAGAGADAVAHAGADEQTAPVAIPVFPINDLLAEVRARRPERILIRGMHLSGIDAVLALSEGLGGRFTTEEDGWHYRSGPYAPTLIWTSRSGKLMPVKTETALLRHYGCHEIAASFANELLLTADLAGVLVRLASALLERALLVWSRDLESGAGRGLGASPGANRGMSASAQPGQFEGIWEEILCAPADPFGALRASLARATGQAPPNAPWALGQAWRVAEPVLIARQRRVAHGRLAQGRVAPGKTEWGSAPDCPASPGTIEEFPLAWPQFARYAPVLNTLAFGPPPFSAHKLLALAEAEVVSIETENSHSPHDSCPHGHPRLHDHPCSQQHSHPHSYQGSGSGHDLAVSAISPPPGLPSGDPLWDGLVAAGLVSRGAARGIRTGPAGTCLDAAGAPVPGLAAIGRMCEDEVLGLDTLVRTMHPEIERWAESVTGAAE